MQESQLYDISTQEERLACQMYHLRVLFDVPQTPIGNETSSSSWCDTLWNVADFIPGTQRFAGFIILRETRNEGRFDRVRRSRTFCDFLGVYALCNCSRRIARADYIDGLPRLL